MIVCCNAPFCTHATNSEQGGEGVLHGDVLSSRVLWDLQWYLASCGEILEIWRKTGYTSSLVLPRRAQSLPWSSPHRLFARSALSWMLIFCGGSHIPCSSERHAEHKITCKSLPRVTNGDELTWDGLTSTCLVLLPLASTSILLGALSCNMFLCFFPMFVVSRWYKKIVQMLYNLMVFIIYYIIVWFRRNCIFPLLYQGTLSRYQKTRHVHTTVKIVLASWICV